MKNYRYYSKLRPVGPGTCPKEGILKVVNFGYRAEHTPAGCPAWGYVDYDHPLSDEEAKAYDLVYCSEETRLKWSENISIEFISDEEK